MSSFWGGVSTMLLDENGRALPARRNGAESIPLVVLGLVFITIYGSTFGSLGMLGWDEAEYASIGRSVARGEGFSVSGEPNPLRPPILPLAVATSLILTGGNQEAGPMLPAVLFSVLALFVVYVMMRIECDHLTGMVGAILLGSMPAFWSFSAVLMTENPFLVFFTGAVAAFYFGLYRDGRWFYASWVAFAFAMLTRYTAVFFGPIAFCFALFALTDAGARKRIASRSFWISPFVGLALLLPWLLREQMVFGSALVGFQRASTQLQSFLPELSMPWYFYPVHVPEMISFFTCIPLVVGIVWAVVTRDRFALHMLVVAAFVLGWFSFYRFKEVRMAMTALPFLAVVAALGITRATLPARLTPKWIGGLTVFLILVFASSAVANRSYFSQVRTIGYPSFIDAMQFVRQHTAPTEVMMGASVSQIFWYADRRVIDFPDEQDLSASLSRCDWIVVTNYEREQKDYAGKLPSLITQDDIDRGDALIVTRGHYSTAVFRAGLIRNQLIGVQAAD